MVKLPVGIVVRCADIDVGDAFKDCLSFICLNHDLGRFWRWVPASQTSHPSHKSQFRQLCIFAPYSVLVPQHTAHSMPDIFISYSRKDSEPAVALAERLR